MVGGQADATGHPARLCCHDSHCFRVSSRPSAGRSCEWYHCREARAENLVIVTRYRELLSYGDECHVRALDG